MPLSPIKVFEYTVSRDRGKTKAGILKRKGWRNGSEPAGRLPLPANVYALSI